MHQSALALLAAVAGGVPIAMLTEQPFDLRTHDYADKSWIKRLARPTWMCMLRSAAERADRAVRRLRRNDNLARGVRFRVEDGLMYVEPNPNSVSF